MAMAVATGMNMVRWRRRQEKKEQGHGSGLSNIESEAKEAALRVADEQLSSFGLKPGDEAYIGLRAVVMDMFLE
ncbi:hypothetical protein LTR27_005507 [Elasticomyces elasticus]|nr:hypothetical protein LTR27_005507 [Elasticomyces elasticus]